MLITYSEEPQTAVLHWRAITYARSTKRTDAVENFIVKLQKELEEHFKHIFILAGESPSSQLVANIKNIIAKSRIIEFALDMSKTLKTKLFSVHLDVFMCSPGELFDEDVMIDDFGISKNASNQLSVLCPLELGIREVVQRERVGRVLLKPRVYLQVGALHQEELCTHLLYEF